MDKPHGFCLPWDRRGTMHRGFGAAVCGLEKTKNKASTTGRATATRKMWGSAANSKCNSGASARVRIHVQRPVQPAASSERGSVPGPFQSPLGRGRCLRAGIDQIHPPEPRPATRADEPYDKLKSSMCSRPRSFSVRCHRMDKLTATTRKETGMASPQSQELARRAGVIDWFGHHPLSWDLTFRVAEAVGLSAGRAETARRVRAVGSSPCRTRAKASASGRPDHGGSLAWMPKTRRDRTAHSRCRSSPRADCNSLSRFAPPSGADTARFQSISAA